MRNAADAVADGAAQGSTLSPEGSMDAGSDLGAERHVDAGIDLGAERHVDAKSSVAAAQVDVRAYSALSLAFLGDAVCGCVVREALMARGSRPVEALSAEAKRYVSAPAQAMAIQALLPELSEEEADAYRRGRNARPHSRAKHATRREYLLATGYEALLGYLQLSGREERAAQLVRRGMALLDEGIDEGIIKG